MGHSKLYLLKQHLIYVRNIKINVGQLYLMINKYNDHKAPLSKAINSIKLNPEEFVNYLKNNL